MTSLVIAVCKAYINWALNINMLIIHSSNVIWEILYLQYFFHISVVGAGITTGLKFFHTVLQTSITFSRTVAKADTFQWIISRQASQTQTLKMFS